jgi:cytochrome c-type biogenesis protein CcmH
MTEITLFLAFSWLLAGAFLLVLPRIWRRPHEGESVDDWLAIRQGETDDADLLADAELRVWDDQDAARDSAVAKPPSSSRILQAAALLGVFAASFALYQNLGAEEDVLITRQLAALGQSEQPTPADVEQLIERIQIRSEARPANLDYQSLLGEYYFGIGEIARALEHLEAILVVAPTAPDVLGRAAQAEFIINDLQLTPRAKARAEQALASDPRQGEALETLGMGAFREGAFIEAIGYLRVLRDLAAPGSSNWELTAQVIAEAERRLAAEPRPTETDAVPVIAAAEVATVEVIVERPETAGQALNSGASVFVIARPAGSTARMPTAVIREAATRWPLTVTLSDESSMAGQKLSALERVDIEVQISESGQPGLDNAGFVGRALGVEVGSVTPVSITPLPKQ